MTRAVSVDNVSVGNGVFLFRVHCTMFTFYDRVSFMISQRFNFTILSWSRHFVVPRARYRERDRTRERSKISQHQLRVIPSHSVSVSFERTTLADDLHVFTSVLLSLHLCYIYLEFYWWWVQVVCRGWSCWMQALSTEESLSVCVVCVCVYVCVSHFLISKSSSCYSWIDTT